MIQDPYLHGSVEVLTARPDPPPGALVDTWCCRGCGTDRPLLAAWRTRVRNRSGPAHLRRLRLCASCVRDLIAAGRLDLVAGRTTTGACGPAHEPDRPAPGPAPGSPPRRPTPVRGGP